MKFQSTLCWYAARCPCLMIFLFVAPPTFLSNCQSRSRPRIYAYAYLGYIKPSSRLGLMKIGATIWLSYGLKYFFYWFWRMWRFPILLQYIRYSDTLGNHRLSPNIFGFCKCPIYCGLYGVDNITFINFDNSSESIQIRILKFPRTSSQYW